MNDTYGNMPPAVQTDLTGGYSITNSSTSRVAERYGCPTLDA